MYAYPPCSAARHGPAGAPDRAGEAIPAHPVPSAPIRVEVGRHFQSDGDFATPHAFLANARAESRRLDRIMTRVQLAIAATGVLWAVVPPLCMWLAGGTPA